MQIHAQRVFEDQFRRDINIIFVITSDQDNSAFDAFAAAICDARRRSSFAQAATCLSRISWCSRLSLLIFP